MAPVSAAPSAAMDAIKRKMQAMKAEKDHAMDRADMFEQAAKDARGRASRSEEQLGELVKLAQQLEEELDATREELGTTTHQVTLEIKMFTLLYL